MFFYSDGLIGLKVRSVPSPHKTQADRAWANERVVCHFVNTAQVTLMKHDDLTL